MCHSFANARALSFVLQVVPITINAAKMRIISVQRERKPFRESYKKQLGRALQQKSVRRKRLSLFLRVLGRSALSLVRKDTFKSLQIVENMVALLRRTCRHFCVIAFQSFEIIPSCGAYAANLNRFGYKGSGDCFKFRGWVSSCERLIWLVVKRYRKQIFVSQPNGYKTRLR